MPWPTPQDYNEAVQNPHLAFTDPNLRTGHPELTALQLPRPICGGFACVYKIHSNGRLWAARCFLTEVTDQQQRYDAISKHLSSARLEYTVPFTYLPKGIIVRGNAYPLLKMEWIQGESLSSFIERNLTNPLTLRALAEKWVKMISALQATGISHCDLQHGNILVVGGDLRLIDYDGMFVPALAGNLSRECGHRNYQHPARTELDFGPQLDNFSAWIIWFSLLALAVHPELWRKHRGGDECLILRKEDFLDPTTSVVLRELNYSPNIQIRTLIQLFISLANFSALGVPSLDGSQRSVPVTVPQPQPGSNWWEDHVHPARKTAEVSTRAPLGANSGSVAPDVSWILDSADSAQAAERVGFKSSFKVPRVVLVGTLGMTFLVALAAQLPAFVLVVATVGILGLNLLICLSRYKSDPSVGERRNFERGVDGLFRQIRQHQPIVDSVTAERSKIQNCLANTESDIAAKMAKLQTNYQSESGQTSANLIRELQALDRKRRDFIMDEARDLQAIQRTLGNRIATLDRNAAILVQAENDEKDNALKALQKTFIENYLRRYRIADARVHGIGPALVTRMAMQGITSAFDAQKWNVLQVSGIGHIKAEEMEDWRDRLEAEGRRSAPASLPPLQIANIEERYLRERQTLAREKEPLQTQFDLQVAAIRQRTASRQKMVVQEQVTTRARHDRKIASMKQLHDAEQAALLRTLNSAKCQTATKIAELTDKLNAAQKQTFALHWQSARNLRQMQRFKTLGFGDYVKSVVGL